MMENKSVCFVAHLFSRFFSFPRWKAGSRFFLGQVGYMFYVEPDGLWSFWVPGPWRQKKNTMFKQNLEENHGMI